MEESPERIVGDLPVVAHLAMGYERLTLYFTDRRIIVGRRDKAGAGSVPATFMLGSLGAALSGLLHRGKQVPKPAGQYPSPTVLLASNRDNFSILFDDVISVDLVQTESTNKITLLSKNDKFHFSCGTRFLEVKRLFSARLENKVTSSKKDEV